MGAPFIVLRCQARTGVESPRCDAVAVPASALAVKADEARVFLAAHGMWPAAPPPILVQGAPYAGSLMVQDLGPWLGPAWADKPGILFGQIAGLPTSDDADLVMHELVHHWLRQSGADTPRWVMHDARADNEAAIIQEGLANFVAAARSDNPILGGAAIARGQARPSLRVFARCPEALRGDAHDDSLVLSGALWEARRALTSDVVLAAVARAAPAASDRIANLSVSLEEAFARDSDHSASVWREIAERHRLSHCADPIALSPDMRRSARSDSFVIPAPGHFTTRPERIESPQAFAIRLPANTPSATLTLRSSRKDEPRLSLGWQAIGPSPATGEVALTGWPLQQAELPVPSERPGSSCTSSRAPRPTSPTTTCASRSPSHFPQPHPRAKPRSRPLEPRWPRSPRAAPRRVPRAPIRSVP